MKTKSELLAEFDALKNDIDKWKWIKDHQETGIVINIDNDVIYGVLPGTDDMFILEFDDYIGTIWGILNLLKAYGINAEGV